MLTLICSTDPEVRSTALTDAIREDIRNGRRCCLLVPEQQAYLSEKQFADTLPPSAGRLFEILSFSRLADNVFRRYGGPAAVPVTSAVRSLLMWDTLRTKAPKLRYFRSSGRRDATLTARLLTSVGELESSGIREEALGVAAESVPQDSPLRDKLLDLTELLPAFRERCHRAAGLDPSERLTLLAEKLRAAPLLAGVSVYLDSFTSFTYPEYEILRELMRGEESVTAALCLDRPFSKAPHFASVAETAGRLIRIANETGSPVRQTLLPARHGGRPRSLERLGDAIWNFSNRSREDGTRDGAVTLTRAANRYEEAEFCAEKILELVAGGYRFGEIAVLVRDPESVRGILDAALEEHGIPCFFSERVNLSAKPLSRLVLSAVRAAARGFRTQDIITLLKTGLCGTGLRDTALFEEYCETWHITGRRFLDPVWEMNPDGLTDRMSPRGTEILAAANRVREAVMPPLVTLSDALKASRRISDRCRAVYRYLCDLNISDRLAGQAQKELSLGQIKEAGETLRLYRFVVGSLGELTGLLPDAEPDTEEFLSVLTLFFADADLGSVPNRHDCVIIGSAATARFAAVRAVFLPGVCEGEFPRTVADDGILSDRDKETLDTLGVRFDTRQERRSAEELFYVWRAFGLPTEKLFLSVPATETDGSALAPSLAFSRTAYLLGLPVTDFAPSHPHVPDGSTVTLSAQPMPEGTVLRLSQSSIQDFVLCPYRYYATNILRLRGKKDSNVGSSDEGTFLHFVFEQLLRHALGPDGRLHLPDPAELPALTDRIVGTYLSQVCPIPPDRMDARLLHLFARLREHALLMLRDIVGEVANSRFTPSHFEQTIGGSGTGALPPVTFSLKNGNRVTLAGKIDRVDLWEDGNRVVVRIVDYKAGEHKFSLDEVRTGEDLQLVLYLFAALAPDPARRVPGGAEFLYAAKEDRRTEIRRSGFLLDEESVQAAADTSPDARYTKKGQIDRQDTDGIQKLMDDMRAAVCDTAERILTGEADKTPSEKACRFCPVAGWCDRAVHPKN